MTGKPRILVTGAGGFIGHHLVRRLKNDGFWVRGVDIKVPEFEASLADEFAVLDLRLWENCLSATQNVDQVYNLAADMGGIGYITANHADISRNNILINTHILEASRLERSWALPVFFFRLRVSAVQAEPCRRHAAERIGRGAGRS